MKKTILTVIVTLALIGCGGGGSNPISTTMPTSDGKLPTVDVKYTLNGIKRPTCHNADDIGELTPDDKDFVLCIWLCGKYDNASPIAVSLSFKKNVNTPQGVWELEDEHITEVSNSICKDGTKI